MYLASNVLSWCKLTAWNIKKTSKDKFYLVHKMIYVAWRIVDLIKNLIKRYVLCHAKHLVKRYPLLYDRINDLFNIIHNRQTRKYICNLQHVQVKSVKSETIESVEYQSFWMKSMYKDHNDWTFADDSARFIRLRRILRRRVSRYKHCGIFKLGGLSYNVNMHPKTSMRDI